MSSDKYAQKLANPLWQRKRLEIFQRDNFKCRWCRTSDQQLEVHHLYYKANREPWNYPSGTLVTLCHECHAEAKMDSDQISAWEDLVSAIHDQGGGNFADAVLNYSYPNTIEPSELLRLLSLALNDGTIQQLLNPPEIA